MKILIHTENTIKFVEELNMTIVNQIAFTTTQIEFIKLSNNYLLPIQPLSIIVKQIHNKFKLLSSADMISLNNYIEIKDDKFKKKLLQNGYKISKLFYDEVKGVITSIQFENNLIVPIIHEPYTYNNKLKIINKMINNNLLTSKTDITYRNLISTSLF